MKTRILLSGLLLATIVSFAQDKRYEKPAKPGETVLVVVMPLSAV